VLTRNDEPRPVWTSLPITHRKGAKLKRSEKQKQMLGSEVTGTHYPAEIGQARHVRDRSRCQTAGGWRPPPALPVAVVRFTSCFTPQILLALISFPLINTSLQVLPSLCSPLSQRGGSIIQFRHCFDTTDNGDDWIAGKAETKDRLMKEGWESTRTNHRPHHISHLCEFVGTSTHARL
jgi:hypothetical protein